MLNLVSLVAKTNGVEYVYNAYTEKFMRLCYCVRVHPADISNVSAAAIF